MKLNKSQKVYAIILAVAAVGFLVDRVLLAPGAGGPAQVQAGAVHMTPSGRPRPPTTEPRAATASVAKRLARFNDVRQFDITTVREILLPSPAWLAELQPPEPEPEPDAEAEAPQPVAVAPAQMSPAERFIQRHRLKSTIRRDNGGWALIDGHIVEVGQEFDGYRLVAVTDDGAVFESDRGRVELRLRSHSDP